MPSLAIALLRVCCTFLLSAPWLGSAQVQQSWVQRYRAGTFNHLFAGPALAPNGDVYITGTLTDLNDPQFATVKYNSAGVQLWAVPYNAATNLADTPSAIKLLPDGHVIVAGKSGPPESNVLATVKYSPDGTKLWARHYSIPLDDDYPALLSTTLSGEICVAAVTAPATGGSDVITLKYSSDGELQWAETFSGLVGQNDTASAIATDASGHIYITGQSHTGNNWDYYVVKYNTTGTQSWVARYDGPLRQFDAPTAIVVDSVGNVYVTGSSLGQGPGGIARYELATIKYDHLGDEAWSARYALPGTDGVDTRVFMSLDPADNPLVAVTTTSAQDQECALIKYDPDGNRLWTARFNGAPNAFDAVHGLTVDGDGNSYLATVSDESDGRRFVTLKHDPSGNRLWRARLASDGIFDFPVGIGAHSSGDIFLACQSRYFEGPGGFLTVKYIQTNTPPGAPEIVSPPAHQMAAGGASIAFSVVASGAAPLSFQWRFNGMILHGATNSLLMLSDLTLEHAGHYSVEVTNQFGNVATPEAGLLVLVPPVITSEPHDQFAYAGTEITFTVAAFGTEPFAYQWFHTGSPFAVAQQPLLTLTNLQVADAGLYYAVVSNQSGSATSTVARLTVSPLVQQDWVNTYDGPAHNDDVNPLIKLDAAGNIYVAGTSTGFSDTDVVLLKYSPSGSNLWTARYSAGVGSAETLAAMAVDGAGNIWLTGNTALPDMQPDALTLKFNSNGTLLWAAQFGVTNLFEAGYAIGVDSSGNGYIAGQTGQDFLTIKYSGSGTQLWVGDFNGSGDAIDTARSLAIAGTNIFVVGSSWNGANLDFLTLNYNQQGSLVWNRTYDAGGADNAVAVTVDGSGKIIVTGSSYGTINYGEFGSDYVVVKYSPTGARLWTARYDGFLNAEDYPTALAVDFAGNIYVTGHSDFESEDSGVRQFATLKYDSSGRELWRSWHISRQYDGSRSLAVDADGSVYITSLGVGALSGRDIAFIKYDALGSRVAMVQYNGFQNSDDTPSALALDPGGNVFVTGNSSGASNTGQDIVLVRYSQNAAAGSPIITAVPQGADIAYGSNVVFSVTAAGDAPLSFQWLFNGEAIEDAASPTFSITGAQFENAGSYSVLVTNPKGAVLSPSAVLVVQAPPAILIHPQTQAAVRGSTVLLSVTAAGSNPLFYQWFANGLPLSNEIARTLTLTNVQAPSAGEYQVIVSNRVGTVLSSTAQLIVTHSAQQCWQARFNGPPGDTVDAVQAMAVADDGSMYVTGFSIGSAGADYVTIKYDLNGAELWVARYNGPENGHDFAADIVLDADGNAFVTGRSWGGSAGLDVVTLKYDPVGNEVWSARFNGPNNLEDAGRAIALDTNGNIYVVGSSVAAPFNPNFITIRYSPSGTQAWSATYDGPAGAFDEGVDIVVDSTGSIFVAGTSTLSGVDTDIATIKYNSAGAAVWTRRYSPAADSHESAVRLRLDSQGNPCVGGVSLGANGYGNYSFVKYSAAGNQLWAFQHDGIHRLHDQLSDLLVDPSGNVYLTGTSERAAGQSDYVTIKLNPVGERVWLAAYAGPMGAGSAPGALAFDAAGRICVTGTINTGESIDAATFCYDTNGNRRWTALYAGPVNNSDFGLAIGADPFGNVFVAGSSVNADQSDIFALKYAQSEIVGAPFVITPPQDQSLLVGQTASFGVAAAGASPRTYRWLSGPSVIAEGNARTNITVENVTDSALGYYSVEVFNSLGWTASPAAELRVNGPVVPRFQLIGFTNGLPRLILLGERGFTYQIQASIDLLNWSVVSTNNIQNSSIEFIDSTTGAYLFYRAVKLP